MNRIVIGMDSLDELGGVQTVVRVLADALTERGHHVELVDIEPATRPFRAPSTHTLVEHRLSAVRSELMYEPTTALRGVKLAARGHLRGLTIRKRGVRALRGLFAAQPRPPIFLLTQWRLVEYAVSAGIAGRTIGQYHDCFDAAARNGDLQRIRWASPHLAATCVLTESDAEQFRRAGVPRVHVVTNPVLLPPPVPLHAPREKLVLAAGRLTEQKAFDVLVEAWDRVGPVRAGWRLKIVGSGPDHDLIAHAITRHRLDDCVELVPASHDLGTMMRTASLFAMSSRHEGLPIVLSEALAAGLPFVSTPAAPGISELSDQGRAGVVAASHDPSDLADELRGLILDSDRRQALGAHGRAFIAVREPHAIAARWESLFDRTGLRTTDQHTTSKRISS
ncbi:glycosyltransferase involved in cell wall biosynthesis [Rhodococcus sp. 27YEA15]|uniref:glycosyltransferase n=1 Tax=Rhodococcus sp. 27YEA15 TaxID=3156259 RepID=UPI003C7DCCA1